MTHDFTCKIYKWHFLCRCFETQRKYKKGWKVEAMEQASDLDSSHVGCMSTGIIWQWTITTMPFPQSLTVWEGETSPQTPSVLGGVPALRFRRWQETHCRRSGFHHLKWVISFTVIFVPLDCSKQPKRKSSVSENLSTFSVKMLQDVQQEYQDQYNQRKNTHHYTTTLPETDIATENRSSAKEVSHLHQLNSLWVSRVSHWDPDSVS